MKKLIFVSLILAALLTTGGSRELTDVTLVQVLGVDGAHPVTLTAVGQEEGEARYYQTQGPSVAQAQEGLKKLGETRLEVTHVAQMVLGPDVPVSEVLWQEVTHRKSGYTATLWLTEDGTAGELLRGTADPARRLKSMEENSGVAAPTLLEALSDLAREGRTVLPVLGVSENELAVVGWRTVEEG